MDSKVCNSCYKTYLIDCFYTRKYTNKNGDIKKSIFNICKYCKGVLSPESRLSLDTYLENSALEAKEKIESRKLNKQRKRDELINTQLELAKLNPEHSKECKRCNRVLLKLSFGKREGRPCGTTTYCKFCLSELTQIRNSKPQNLEAKKRRDSKYYQKNREKILSADSRQKRNEYSKDWKLSNRVIDRIKSSKRRAAKKLAVPSWGNSEQINTIFYKAAEFSKLLNKCFEVDHIVPLTSKIVCGLHTIENLQLLEKSLNSKKSNSEWPDCPILDTELKLLIKNFYVSN